MLTVDLIEKVYEFEEPERKKGQKRKILDEEGNFVWNEESDSSSEEEKEDVEVVEEEEEDENENFWSDIEEDVQY